MKFVETIDGMLNPAWVVLIDDSPVPSADSRHWYHKVYFNFGSEIRTTFITPTTYEDLTQA